MDSNRKIYNDLIRMSRAMFLSLLPEIRSASSKIPLTLGRFRIIFAVKMGVNRVGKLAKLAEISQPAMSKTVDGLVREGFLTRVPRLDDRRQIELRVTPKGKSAVEGVE